MKSNNFFLNHILTIANINSNLKKTQEKLQKEKYNFQNIKYTLTNLCDEQIETTSVKTEIKEEPLVIDKIVFISSDKRLLIKNDETNTLRNVYFAKSKKDIDEEKCLKILKSKRGNDFKTDVGLLDIKDRSLQFSKDLRYWLLNKYRRDEKCTIWLYKNGTGEYYPDLITSDGSKWRTKPYDYYYDYVFQRYDKYKIYLLRQKHEKFYSKQFDFDKNELVGDVVDDDGIILVKPYEVDIPEGYYGISADGTKWRTEPYEYHYVRTFVRIEGSKVILKQDNYGKFKTKSYTVKTNTFNDTIDGDEYLNSEEISINAPSGFWCISTDGTKWRTEPYEYHYVWTFVRIEGSKVILKQDNYGKFKTKSYTVKTNTFNDTIDGDEYLNSEEISINAPSGFWCISTDGTKWRNGWSYWDSSGSKSDGPLAKWNYTEYYAAFSRRVLIFEENKLPYFRDVGNYQTTYRRKVWHSPWDAHFTSAPWSDFDNGQPTSTTQWS